MKKKIFHCVYIVCLFMFSLFFFLSLYLMSCLYHNMYNKRINAMMRPIYHRELNNMTVSIEQHNDHHAVPYELLVLHKEKEQIPRQIIDSWRHHHPALTIHTLGDDECKRFLSHHGDTIDLDIFDFLRDGPIKADFFRVVYLYHRGGMYGDADMDVYECVDKYITGAQNGQFVTIRSGILFGYTNPTFIIVRPHHPICLKLWLLYRLFYLHHIPYQYQTYSIVWMMNRLTDYSPQDRPLIELPLVEKHMVLTRFSTIHDKTTRKKIFKNKISSYSRQ